MVRLFTRIPIGVGQGLLELLRTPLRRSSENAQKAKFAEIPFYEVG
jgi:hypothetical protein